MLKRIFSLLIQGMILIRLQYDFEDFEDFKDFTFTLEDL